MNRFFLFACVCLIAGFSTFEGFAAEPGDFLTGLHRVELGPQIRFQQLGDFGLLMRGISGLGPSDFMWSLVLFCFCCVDTKLAARLAVFLLLGLWLREVIALGIGSPRPWWIEPRLRTFGDASGQPHSFGLPSGHAMIGTALWLYVAAEVKKPLVWAAAIVLALLICVSRVYLAVHFISDVTLGAFLGTLYVADYRKVEPRFWILWGKLSPRTRVVISFILSALMIIAPIAVRGIFASDPLPEAWMKFADPGRAVEVCVSFAGGLCGLGLALATVNEWFDRGGEWAVRIMRFCMAVVVLGLAELAGRWILKYGVPRELEGLHLTTVFMIRAGQAFLAWGLMPRLFLKLNLADPRAPDQSKTV
jgi:membrane-associated phospholipid phosphatase